MYLSEINVQAAIFLSQIDPQSTSSEWEMKTPFKLPQLLEGWSVPGAVRALENQNSQGFCAGLGRQDGMEGLQSSQDLQGRRAGDTECLLFFLPCMFPRLWGSPLSVPRELLCLLEGLKLWSDCPEHPAVGSAVGTAQTGLCWALAVERGQGRWEGLEGAGLNWEVPGRGNHQCITHDV